MRLRIVHLDDTPSNSLGHKLRAKEDSWNLANTSHAPNHSLMIQGKVSAQNHGSLTNHGRGINRGFCQILVTAVPRLSWPAHASLL